MVKKISTEELLKRYAAGERDFNGYEIYQVYDRYGRRHLKNADLRNLQLIDGCLDSID